MEAIAREVGKSASTVAYWVNKHGLASVHAARHQARGALEEAELRALVEQGLSVRQIAAEVGRSATAVRHWLRRYGLTTAPLHYAPQGAPDAVMRECRRHGWVSHSRDSEGYRRCPACRSEAVIRRRRTVKAMLVQEAGGACVRCGFDEHVCALQFHHLDPAAKDFEIGGRGLTRAIERLRAEARKCVLLCANCHAAVEAGVANLPPASESLPG
jgi:AraC-like DNA-binding protein